MKKILITGSAGFIGFHLCKALEKNYSLVGIDNLNNYYDKQLKIDNRFGRNQVILALHQKLLLQKIKDF